MILVKHSSKMDKPYIRDVQFGSTGLDVFYGEEKQAMQFSSRGAAIHVAKALYAYGNFYVVEVEEEE